MSTQTHLTCNISGASRKVAISPDLTVNDAIPTGFSNNCTLTVSVEGKEDVVLQVKADLDNGTVETRAGVVLGIS